jgi:hypothetical protein
MISKLYAPFTNGFMAYANASEGKLIMNIPVAMVKSMIGPYGLANNGYRKTISWGTNGKSHRSCLYGFSPFLTHPLLIPKLS